MSDSGSDRKISGEEVCCISSGERGYSDRGESVCIELVVDI